MKSLKSSRLLLPLVALMGVGISVSAPPVQADYTELNGVPVTPQDILLTW